jgi:flavodoxin
LEAYDFSGKTIIPFCSHEGSGLGSGVSDIEKACPNSVILTGLEIRGSKVGESKENITEWIDSLGIMK